MNNILGKIVDNQIDCMSHSCREDYKQFKSKVISNIDTKVWNQVCNQLLNEVWEKVWTQAGSNLWLEIFYD